jgi:acyl-CoA thioesterase FadM
MDPTGFKFLIEEGGVTCNPDGITVLINPSWIIEGEYRASYTTLIRLVECCREYHWEIDIIPKAKGTPLDSITKSVSGEFIRPIKSGIFVSISYHLIDVRDKGYSILFEIRDKSSQALYARITLVCVFIDLITSRPITPPISVYEYILSCVKT